jgi:hypothetical protein
LVNALAESDKPGENDNPIITPEIFDQRRNEIKKLTVFVIALLVSGIFGAQAFAQTYHHSDGSSTTKIGNSYHHSDGSTTIKIDPNR